MRTMQAFQEFEDHLAGPEVQISRRFVGQQDGGLSDQRAGQYHALLLSSRKFTGAMRRPRPKPNFIQPRYRFQGGPRCGSPRISNGIITFSSAVNSGSR